MENEVNNHPQSRGVVRLRSANPHEPPLVDPRYFSNREDLEAFVQAPFGLRNASLFSRLRDAKSSCFGHVSA